MRLIKLIEYLQKLHQTHGDTEFSIQVFGSDVDNENELGDGSRSIIGNRIIDTEFIESSDLPEGKVIHVRFHQ